MSQLSYRVTGEIAIMRGEFTTPKIVSFVEQISRKMDGKVEKIANNGKVDKKHSAAILR